MTQIDWKYFATTSGYKSLKAAYIKDVQDAAKQKHPMRDKAEFLKHFNWVINRAKHHAYHKGISIWTILDLWEKYRNGQWWLGYYTDHGKQAKIRTTNVLKPMGINGIRKSYKTAWYSDPARTKIRVMEAIKFQQEKDSTKKKKRWTMEYKKRHRS